MDNYELAAKFRGKTDGLRVVYGDKPPTGTINSGLTAEDRLAFAYCKDVGELCSVVEMIPDNADELEAARAEADFWKRLVCRCECDPPAVIIETRGEQVSAKCETCGAEFSLPSRVDAKKKTR